MDTLSHGAKIRRMGQKDQQAVLDLINAEGWEYHISEIERILLVDPSNSIVACSGETVVGATTVALTGRRCVLGHVVVRQGWRNKSIGKMMMDDLAQKMDALGVQSMEAFAVPAAVPFYKRHGYRSVEEIDTYDKYLTDADIAGIASREGIRVLRDADLDAIRRLDEEVTGFERVNILRRVMGEFPGAGRGLFDGGEMTAFFLSRVNPIMNDLGPWVMARPDCEQGELLLRSILGGMKAGQRALGGVSMNNSVVREIFLGLGFKAIHKAYRMMRSKGALEPFRPGMMTLGAFELG